MSDWNLGHCLFAVGLFSMFFGGRIERWWFGRQIRKAVDFDRICHLADIERKEIGYNIVETYRISGSRGEARHFGIQFIYAGSNYAGEVQHFDTISEISGIEEKVASSISDIKQQQAKESRGSGQEIL